MGALLLARYAATRALLAASTSTAATSGRLNSGGGDSPARSISRTFVPLSTTCDSAPCGHVLVDAMPSHARAEERVIEEQRRDAQLARRELAEDVVRVVRAVVVADTGVVAADDEVRAAVVLAHQRVEDRFARPGVAHRRRQHAQQHAILRVVVVEQDLVAAHAHVGRDVVVLGLADQRVQQQAVDDLERGLLEVLVRAVHRVARLEADDALPLALGERAARVGRIERVGPERPRRGRCARAR